eukprot:CAMPEP_0197543066 /NCGR_PEP_ID=MMETSP1318-20131121/68041_1 /TAXON_ID=552666 /ORGANISM="Partenskyella glossopodia, Strain RCC365" /LENGTH=645 /DNA_ID=CAMNT_0043102375 /DNA_START=173 /DNA_END=2110 /DNA_ORIENTATION=+
MKEADRWTEEKWTRLQQSSSRCWLEKKDIIWILSNSHSLEISVEPRDKPKMGSLFLFNRKMTRRWRADGHEWKQKNDSHERLKVDGETVLGCCYNTHRSMPEFHRRGYWLLSNPDIMLVHYASVKAPVKRRNSKNRSPALLRTMSRGQQQQQQQQQKQQQQQQQQQRQQQGAANMFASNMNLKFDLASASLASSSIEIKDFSPSWDLATGGSKVLFVVESCGPAELGEVLWGVFGQQGVRVVAEKVIRGVYRLAAPACPVALRGEQGVSVDMYLTDGIFRSRVFKFRYFRTMAAFASAASAGVGSGSEGQHQNHHHNNSNHHQRRQQHEGEAKAIADEAKAIADEATVELTKAFSNITLRDMGINTSDIEGPVSDEVFNSAAERIQRQFRLYLYRRHDAAQKLQKFMRGVLVRRKNKRSHDAAVVIQSQFRTNKVRREYQKLKHAAIMVQNNFRTKKRNRQRSPTHMLGRESASVGTSSYHQESSNNHSHSHDHGCGSDKACSGAREGEKQNNLNLNNQIQSMDSDLQFVEGCLKSSSEENVKRDRNHTANGDQAHHHLHMQQQHYFSSLKASSGTSRIRSNHDVPPAAGLNIGSVIVEERKGKPTLYDCETEISMSNKSGGDSITFGSKFLEEKVPDMFLDSPT